MNDRETATPEEWTINTSTTAEERAEAHRELMGFYSGFFWGEAAGIMFVGALLATAVRTWSDPDAAPRILAASAIGAILYRFAVAPVLARATLARTPAPAPSVTLRVSDEGLGIANSQGNDFYGWDWVSDIEEKGTGAKANVSIVLRTYHEIAGPATRFPKEALDAIRARIKPAGSGTTRTSNTCVDRGLTPIAGGLVRFRESGDTVLNPTTRPPVLSAAEILAIRVPFALPPFLLAAQSEQARHWPHSAYTVGALALSIAFGRILFTFVPTQQKFALARFNLLFQDKALRRLTVQLCEEGLAYEWDGGSSLTEWHNVEAVPDTEKCIGYRIGLIFQAIPKKAFQPSELEAFQEIAARKIAAAKKPSE